jgi:aspartyl protease family protein
MRGKRRECKAVLLALLLALQATTASAQEDEINVVGLSQGKAVVTVGANPRPRVLRDGDSLPNGARLIKATPESAVFEINGERRTISMGNHVSAAAPSSGGGQVILSADERGHFVTTGTINGGTVQFLVDTGATMISMGRGDARRVGINYLKGQKGLSNTANGVAPVYRVKVDTVRVGDITLNNVDALVHDQDLPWVLLGMSFLNRVEMRREGGNLTLIKRY